MHNDQWNVFDSIEKIWQMHTKFKTWLPATTATYYIQTRTNMAEIYNSIHDQQPRMKKMWFSDAQMFLNF